jgi:ubiquinone/menaquinone biosynthesis C-methylase UbiE
MEAKTKTHEKKVEDFYSTGLNRDDYKYDISKENLNGKFLSFGYWETGNETYLEAARKLLNFFIENSEVKKAERILNVCCGYGTETFAYYEKFKPKLIEGIDITKVEVDYANDKAKALGVDKNIVFHHGDACVLNFPENSFSYVFGIEGPANFNTRENFFNAAGKVLKKGGELILTDIILGEKFKKEKKAHNLFVGFASKGWVVPRANWVDEETYKKQIENAGMKVVLFKKIGDKVFPGYAGYCSRTKTMKSVKEERGTLAAAGFTLISMALGYLYKKGWIEYIYVKAKKI